MCMWGVSVGIMCFGGDGAVGDWWDFCLFGGPFVILF